MMGLKIKTLATFTPVQSVLITSVIWIDAG